MDEVEEEEDGDAAAQDEIEEHGIASLALEAVAREGVGGGQGEEAHGRRHQDQVEHLLVPSAGACPGNMGAPGVRGRGVFAGSRVKTA